MSKLQERINKILEIPSDVRISFTHTDEGKHISHLLVGYQEVDMDRIDESDVDAILEAIKLLSIYKIY